MSEVTGWITVNGQHIPLMKGESKAKAVARFIKGKRDKKVSERKDYLKRTLATSGLKQDDKEFEKMAKEDIKEGRPKIKGYAETREAKLDRLSDIAADREIEKDNLRTRGSLREYQNAKIRYERADKAYEKAKAEPIKKYKMNAEKITPGENALQRYAQVSNSSYNLSNIKAKELPSGAIHITTKSGKDISTISPKALTKQQKDELRKRGILK